MTAQKTSKCLDRCGLTIHAGHDEIEPGHFGWRHVDCDKAHRRAWIRERIDAGDTAADVQIKLLMNPVNGPMTIDDGEYILDYYDQR